METSLFHLHESSFRAGAAPFVAAPPKRTRTTRRRCSANQRVAKCR